MKDDYPTGKDLYDFEYGMKNSPHVVLLGAGASCAAIPNGDKYGKKISAMNGFIDKLGLSDVLEDFSLKTTSDNLEEIYMELDERSLTEPDCMSAKVELENRIRNYMLEFKLPDTPTIYDFLLMSLTSKDIIATFNWDPLLVQAISRAYEYTDNLPNIAFLHGNVAVGFCEKDNVMGNAGYPCRCSEILKPTQLLFPIKKKDYASDTAIAKSWKSLKNALKAAYMVTIFGYSAPKSDAEAISMLKEAWGDTSDRNLEEIEIIDLRPEDEVVASWEEFIHTHHYKYSNSFFDSSLGRFPRRSCEVNFEVFMKNGFVDGNNGFKEGMGFSDIDRLTYKLIAEESEKKGTRKMLSNPYKVRPDKR